MGIATRVAVRLTPNPPAVATMLCAFDSIDAAAAAVTGTIAGGVLPAALEMMDARITAAVEDFVGAGYPRDAQAVLLVEVDGLDGGVAAQADAVRDIAYDCGAVSVRVAADDAERALLWKGRKSAFGAIARIAPDYYLHDAVVPRTRLVQVLRGVYDIADAHDLVTMNVFHAGDGNLHPLVLYDRQIAGQEHAAEALSYRILELCLAAGGSITGEHGVGEEKKRMMSKMFSEPDLATMQRVRCAFDPLMLSNPSKVFPTPRLCGEKPGEYVAHPLETAGIAERF
jgi:glycolate oxidase